MRWTRPAGVLAAAAAVVALAATAQPAAAAPAGLTNYSEATYLQHALGLPASDTDPAIEPVTYDRFQWLLQQPGDFAVLIGDPALDATFAARAQAVEAAAKAKNVKKVYWFDPNLSGSAKVGTINEPALDIRNAGAITQLPATSQAKYDNAWQNLVGSYLGNGLTVVQNGVDSESATVTVTTGTNTVNDNGSVAGHSTKVGDLDGGALYNYKTGTPANALHSFFFIYNKDHKDGADAAKVVSWTELTTQADAGSTTSAVNTAIDKAGAANLEELDQFDWWKDEVNAKQAEQAPNVAQGASNPVLTDADGADGWQIDQITYPELVDLLKSTDGENAVILFGGTWCPNTRPVLPAINKYAKQHGVKVYNFDTVLDGGVVGGATTSSVNPLQTRNTQQSGSGGSAVQKANPSFLYGDLVNQYLTNIKTQYDYTTGGSSVTFYPGGDYGKSLTTTWKLQVPFLVGYKGGAGTDPNAGVQRQWIIKNANKTYTEYMSQWYYTSPRPNQLGITTIPLTAPIWSTINSQLASFTWQSDPTQNYVNTAIDTDDTQFLVDADTATVKYTAASGSTAASVTVTSAGTSPITISPAALSSALAALGASAPANYAAAKTALIDAKTAATPDAALVSNLTTVVGAWGVAQTRKNKVNAVWGSATAPGSVAGGLAAVHAVDVFFTGLPNGFASRRTVTADPVTVGTAPTITVKIDNDYGFVPDGTVALTVKQGGTSVTTASATVADGKASFSLPALDAGSYDYALSYAGDLQIAPFTETGSLTVKPAEVTPITTPDPGPGTNTNTTPGTGGASKNPTPAQPARVKVSKVAGAVTVKPTSKKGGKYKVTVTAPKGSAAASGKVTIKLKKGKVTKTLTGTLSKGVVTVTLPKLAKGTWKVTITWPGDTKYLTASAAGASIKVIK
ncbi:Ig-like domain-containing protein [Baekduia sp. Peel2402]|uniref:Ig-like domain-containing protein n=1 Tax=Baekduia sp. Peel2402 TaxID=3458296 RepID=UPI00403EF3E8